MVFGYKYGSIGKRMVCFYERKGNYLMCFYIFFKLGREEGKVESFIWLVLLRVFSFVWSF